jgi:hypothetical protein
MDEIFGTHRADGGGDWPIWRSARPWQGVARTRRPGARPLHHHAKAGLDLDGDRMSGKTIIAFQVILASGLESFNLTIH